MPKHAASIVALLDADDRWYPNHLSASVQALQQTGKDLVYSSVLMIEDQTEMLLGVWGPDAWDLKDFPHGLYRRNFITPSATVMRREVLADVGPWGLGFRYCEDADYWFRCLAAGKQFHYLGGCHCLYRKNHDGATTQRLCGTLEEFAEISERYVDVAGLRTRTLQEVRLAGVSQRGPLPRPFQSARRSLRRRVPPPLTMKAWRLRRKHVEYLWHATKFAAQGFFRRRKQPALNVQTPHVVGQVGQQTAKQKAA